MLPRPHRASYRYVQELLRYHSALGQTVRNAQALGLDKNVPGANCLDTELRRRAWWDLWCCDTLVTHLSTT